MDFETCDLIFYKGTSLRSYIIRAVTDSPYSHVALILDRFHVIETNFLTPVRIAHQSYPTASRDVFRADLDEVQKRKIIEYCMSALRRRYDTLQVLSHITNRYLGLPILNNYRRADCSELIVRAFNFAGVELLPDNIGFDATPGDLANSLLLTKLT